MRGSLELLRPSSLLLFLVLLAGPACRAFGEEVLADDAKDLKSLETALAREMDGFHKSSGFPGAVLGGVLPDGRTFAVASGFADSWHKIPMRTDHRMFSGSTGKTFVAATALLLVEEGKLDLDAKVSKYLGDRPWFGRLPNHEALTIRLLMSHRSGIPRYVMKEALWRDLMKHPDRDRPPESLIAMILDEPAVHPPGEGWAYSDTNYLILGLVLEQVAGEAYNDMVQERLLKPLGLTATTPSSGRDIENLACGVTSKDVPPFFLPGEVMKDGRYIFRPDWEWTGGGLVTNALDLARWAAALYGGKVLKKESLKKMLTLVETGPRTGFRYGLGVMAYETDLGRIYGHGGIFPGFATQMEYLPRLGAALALQINADSTSGKLDRSHRDYLAALWPHVVKFLEGEAKRPAPRKELRDGS